MLSINLIFTSLLITSTLVVVSSPSWFCLWIGIEMNTMAFIPMMYKYNNKLSAESTLKYFLTQTFASMIMMMAIIMMMTKTFNLYYSSSIIMTLSMSIKLGMAPFYMWYPTVIEGLNWMQNLILMTWQKIAPLSIISNTNPSNFFNFIIISSLMIGAIGAYNQTSTRKIMAYSSITHMSWILSMMYIKSITWMTYMLIYFITSLILISLFYMNNTYQILQINNTNSIETQIMMFISLLSLGGFPPLLGFMGKWMVLNDLLMNNMFTISIIMIISSWMSLYIYIRIVYSLILAKSEKMKNLNHPISNTNSFSMMLIITLMPLFIMIM